MSEPDNWLDEFKDVAGRFEEENTDLEAMLEGDIGFHTFFVAEGGDPTRGVKTAIHTGLEELLEPVHVDAEIVEMRHGQVTPETVRLEVENQMDEHVHVPREMRAAIGESVADRVRRNIDE